MRVTQALACHRTWLTPDTLYLPILLLHSSPFSSSVTLDHAVLFPTLKFIRLVQLRYLITIDMGRVYRKGKGSAYLEGGDLMGESRQRRRNRERAHREYSKFVLNRSISGIWAALVFSLFDIFLSIYFMATPRRSVVDWGGTKRLISTSG